MEYACSVQILSAPFAIYSYKIPAFSELKDWQIGQRVLSPLGKTLRAGLILDMGPPPEGISLRAILWPLERRPLFSPAYLKVMQDLAVRQMTTVGRILSYVLPHGLRDASEFCLPDGTRLSSVALQKMSFQEQQQYWVLWQKGDMQVRRVQRREDPFFGVKMEPPWPVRPQATAQKKVLDFLYTEGAASLSRIRAFCGTQSGSIVKNLVQRGLLQALDSALPAMLPAPMPSSSFVLSPDQEQVCARLKDLFSGEQAETALLHGVTGSGKTAVYIALIEACLEAGRPCMLLAPEVAIALKLYADLQAALPEVTVVCFHGYLSPVRRQEIFEKLSHKEGGFVVVGTRSCLFLPCDPLLIILDEEHDASFKQTEGLVYQAKEVAFGRIAQSCGLLLLGSATPDMKMYHHAVKGIGVHLLELPRRITGTVLPEISLVDMRRFPADFGPFSLPVRDQLLRTLAAGQQAIILHNRRGYSPVLYCQSCNESVRCPHCQISLTFHKKRSQLLCHYCGFSHQFPLLCPTCKSSAFLPLGSGTERLEEFLQKQLPVETRVLRLDRDSTQRSSALEETLSAFARQEAQILVGTQMLSKGHHFPGVTLVVVVDGDLGLSLPDYRATERAFQMLVQVAGRAGRGKEGGQVLIQTRNPKHYCWQYVLGNDYQGFFTYEIALRKTMHYPPFSKLALVRLSWPMAFDQSAFLAVLREQGGAFAARAGVRMLGPAPAMLAVLRGRQRYQCLLKGEDWSVLRAVYAQLIQLKPTTTAVRMSLDLDPIDML